MFDLPMCPHCKVELDCREFFFEDCDGEAAWFLRRGAAQVAIEILDGKRSMFSLVVLNRSAQIKKIEVLTFERFYDII